MPPKVLFPSLALPNALPLLNFLPVSPGGCLRVPKTASHRLLTRESFYSPSPSHSLSPPPPPPTNPILSGLLQTTFPFFLLPPPPPLMYFCSSIYLCYLLLLPFVSWPSSIDLLCSFNNWLQFSCCSNLISAKTILARWTARCVKIQVCTIVHFFLGNTFSQPFPRVTSWSGLLAAGACVLCQRQDCPENYGTLGNPMTR